jgi:hypothetical protein
MGIKGLIDDQTIIIDDHKRGSGEIKNWDNKATDIHIDKFTNFPVDGKRQKVRIKIPINSDRDINIENRTGGTLNEIPRKLQKEIKKAFEDKTLRDRFITDVFYVVKNFDSILSDEEKAHQILKKLSKHFNLKWTEENIAIYSNGILNQYTELYTDQNRNMFFIQLNKEKITIGQDNNSYERK